MLRTDRATCAHPDRTGADRCCRSQWVDDGPVDLRCRDGRWDGGDGCEVRCGFHPVKVPAGDALSRNGDDRGDVDVDYGGVHSDGRGDPGGHGRAHGGGDIHHRCRPDDGDLDVHPDTCPGCVPPHVGPGKMTTGDPVDPGRVVDDAGDAQRRLHRIGSDHTVVDGHGGVRHGRSPASAVP